MRAPSTSSRRRRLGPAVLALLLVAALAACGSSSSSDDAAPSTTKASSPTDGPNSTETTETEKPTTTKGGGTAASGSEQDYIDALISSYDEAKDGDDLTKDQVTCLATGWVKGIGAETFEKAGVSPAQVKSGDQNFDDLDLTEVQANKMVDVYGDCDVDVKALMLKSFSSGSTTPAQKACIEKTLTPDALHELLVSSILGDSAQDGSVMKALMACAS